MQESPTKINPDVVEFAGAGAPQFLALVRVRLLSRVAWLKPGAESRAEARCEVLCLSDNPPAEAGGKEERAEAR
jgi:hypothetical protein